MSVREILSRAKERLSEPFRWTQCKNAKNADGQAVLPESSSATCWCLNGAIKAEISSPSEYQAAIKALGFHDVFQMTAWNDQPERSHTEVLARIDEALK